MKITARPLAESLRLHSMGERVRLPLFRTICAEDWRTAIGRPRHNAVSIQIKAAIAAKLLLP